MARAWPNPDEVLGERWGLVVQFPITASDPSEAQAQWRAWDAWMAERPRTAGEVLHAVTCGPFTGCRLEFVLLATAVRSRGA